MKKSWIIVIILIVFVMVVLTGGVIHIIQNPIKKPVLKTDSPVYKNVEPVGEVPESFKNIVKNNLFCDAYAYGDKLIKVESRFVGDGTKNQLHLIQTMDKYGNTALEYELTTDDVHHIESYRPTEDGGLLFVLGFRDKARDQGTWASDSGYASRIIKIDKDGNIQFDTAFDQLEGRAFEYCFEKNKHFYFFGEYQTPETKTKGVYSPSDIIMHILDKQGSCLRSSIIAGSDFDSLSFAKMFDDRFTLFIYSQSDDGDFIGSDSNGYIKSWIFTVNDSLEITEKKLSNESIYLNQLIGIKGSANIYADDPLFSSFDAGTPSALIDYGDFYMIISRNLTGTYNHPHLALSSLQYYTETVYSAYDNSGKLLFRAGVDSSPDYAAMFEAFNDTNGT